MLRDWSPLPRDAIQALPSRLSCGISPASTPCATLVAADEPYAWCCPLTSFTPEALGPGQGKYCPKLPQPLPLCGLHFSLLLRRSFLPKPSSSSAASIQVLAIPSPPPLCRVSRNCPHFLMRLPLSKVRWAELLLETSEQPPDWFCSSLFLFCWSPLLSPDAQSPSRSPSCLTESFSDALNSQKSYPTSFSARFSWLPITKPRHR